MPHICDGLIASAKETPQKVVTVCGTTQRTAEAFAHAVAALAASLAAQGVKPGHRVALLSHNTDRLLQAILAIAAAGGISVPLNWRWTPTEVAAALERTQPTVVFCEPALQHLISSAVILGPDQKDQVQQPGEPAKSVEASQEGASASTGCRRANHSSGAILRSRGVFESSHRQWSNYSRVVLLGPAQQPHPGMLVNEDHLVSARQGALTQALHNDSGLAMIVFTSGTTGAAKGVCLSHATLQFQAKVKVQAVGYSSEDVYLHAAPLCHVGGLVSWLSMLQVGAQHILLPAFSARAVVELIQQHQVTALIAVPAMIADLLAQQQQQQQQQPDKVSSVQPLLSVRRVLLGGGELPAALHAGLRALFPAARVVTAYGMTECASSITYADLEQPSAVLQAGSLVGRAPAGIQVAIRRLSADEAASARSAPAETSASYSRDPRMSPPRRSAGSSRRAARGISWQEAQEGEPGEVVTCGQHVMTGYWGDPSATSAVFLPDGWLRTGDLGQIDAEENIWLLGRLKDVIRSGSENVAAGEVEKVLLRHPGIKAAAVVGLPHSRLGEQVAALLVLHSSFAWEGSCRGSRSTLTSAELVQFCRTQGLAGFKLPRVLHTQEGPLPVNSSGKLLKQEVRAKLLRLEDAVLRSHL